MSVVDNHNQDRCPSLIPAQVYMAHDKVAVDLDHNQIVIATTGHNLFVAAYSWACMVVDKNHAFAAGNQIDTDQAYAFAAGNLTDTDQAYAFAAGNLTDTDQACAFAAGNLTDTDQTCAFAAGNLTDTDQAYAFAACSHIYKDRVSWACCHKSHNAFSAYTRIYDA